MVNSATTTTMIIVTLRASVTAARGVCTGSICGSRASENCASRVST